MSGPTFAKPRYGDRGPSLCGLCGSVLHRVLIAAGYAHHPGCDPDEQPWEWKRGDSTRVPRPLPPIHREQPKRGFKRPSELIKEREENAR